MNPRARCDLAAPGLFLAVYGALVGAGAVVGAGMRTRSAKVEARARYFRLTAGGGEEVQCGWLADKYGLSWQVVPSKFFDEWVKDAVGLQRVMREVMQMKKLGNPGANSRPTGSSAGILGSPPDAIYRRVTRCC